jgi:phosphomevalonate kinase
VGFGVPLQGAHKTGLGSSAALVTAFTAAVLAYYLPVEPSIINTAVGKARIHNLAQAAHCSAQGKIGSGFDVAAAVYGSCVYRRFDPAILKRIGEVGSPDFAKRLRMAVDDDGPVKIWDTHIDKSSVSMPKGLRLVMCDVDCGSETPGMVKKVFEWRKENPEEAMLLWATLQKGNEDLARELRDLAKTASTSTASYENLSEIILTIRSLIREMSAKARVPIEPDVQTDLIDACCQVSGVIGGVVPGAGGFDAIALLIEDHQETVEELDKFLAAYKVNSKDPDQKTIGKVRLLGVKQEMVGIRAEGVDIYKGWLEN